MDKNTRILIVDDYKTMLRIMHNLLRQIGFSNVEEAWDGSLALGRLIEGNYDLVIADSTMEPKDGMWLLNRMRANEKLGNLPFIMIAAESKGEIATAVKDAGANAILVKPFNAATLKSKLTKVLGAPAEK